MKTVDVLEDIVWLHSSAKVSTKTQNQILVLVHNKVYNRFDLLIK